MAVGPTCLTSGFPRSPLTLNGMPTIGRPAARPSSGTCLTREFTIGRATPVSAHLSIRESDFALGGDVERQALQHRAVDGHSLARQARVDLNRVVRESVAGRWRVLRP